MKIEKYKSHQGFDIFTEEGVIKARSHNFPEIVGWGKTEEEALLRLNHGLLNFRDNNPSEVRHRLAAMLKKGLVCACGKKRADNERILGIVDMPMKEDEKDGLRSSATE